MEFDIFYRKNFSKAFRFFYYHFINKNDSEDLCQEVFLRFYQNHSKYISKAEEECLKIFYGYCRNVLLEYYRKQKNSKEFSSEDDFSEEIISPEELQHFKLFDDNYKKYRKEKLNEIKSAMSKLSEKHAKVIEYRFFQNLSRSETARRMCLDEDTVHTYQKRAIKNLNKLVHNINKIVPPLALLL